MKNQTGAAIAAIASSVNWERQGFDIQAIIEAANKGKLGKPLTDWLVSKGWETNTPTVPVSVKTADLLEFISTVTVPETSERFVAKDKFVVNTQRNAKVKISYLMHNFTKWFLSGDGKAEDPISEQTLRYHTLRQSSVDGPIITELGGEEKSETTLTEMFSLMEKQKNGEDGVLLNDDYANIFYIRDQNGVLRAVFVYWSGGGWGVDASSVERSAWRSGGVRVFSRNSDLQPSEPSA